MNSTHAIFFSSMVHAFVESKYSAEPVEGILLCYHASHFYKFYFPYNLHLSAKITYACCSPFILK